MLAKNIAIVSLSSLIHTLVQGDGEIGVFRKLKGSYPDWKPRGIIDVGANEGFWTQQMCEFVFEDKCDIPTLMIEPWEKQTEKLEVIKKKYSPHVDFKIAFLSDKDNDSMEFYNAGGGGTGNSMFKENSRHHKDLKPQIIKTSKLDTIVNHMEYIDYLKIDVQGAELLVLKGATETLKRVTFVQIEVSLVEYNIGGVCWYEIDDFMRSNGFYLYDQADWNVHPDAFHTKGIGQLDVLYVRPSSPYMPKWLIDNKVSFCGSNRIIEIDEKKSHFSLFFGIHCESCKVLLLFITVFLFGYFTGRMSLQFKSQGKKN